VTTLRGTVVSEGCEQVISAPLTTIRPAAFGEEVTTLVGALGVRGGRQ
jgi:hypothetical protein